MMSFGGNNNNMRYLANALITCTALILMCINPEMIIPGVLAIIICWQYEND